jgi:hypothetical protein
MEVEMGQVVDGTDILDSSNSEVLLFQKKTCRIKLLR